jgi:hypothetical protein
VGALFFLLTLYNQGMEITKDVTVVEEKKEVIPTFSPKPENLNERQELFCELYATHQDFFGNGVQTYIEVYDPDQHKPNWYAQACVSANQILSNIKVTDRINELMIECGLNDVAVDQQLAFLITQHENKIVKLGAIKEYNTLRGRIIKKQEITFKPLPPESAMLANLRKVQAEEIVKEIISEDVEDDNEELPVEEIIENVFDHNSNS